MFIGFRHSLFLTAEIMFLTLDEINDARDRLIQRIVPERLYNLGVAFNNMIATYEGRIIERLTGRPHPLFGNPPLEIPLIDPDEAEPLPDLIDAEEAMFLNLIDEEEAMLLPNFLMDPDEIKPFLDADTKKAA